MPILRREPDQFPAELLEQPDLGGETGRSWWVAHTYPRQEKSLVRRLHAHSTWHYLPQTENKFRSPNGRSRTSYVPLFPGYVFLYGSDQERGQALETGCVVRILDVEDGRKLTADLRQIKRLLDSGCPLTTEAELSPGELVRVTTGPFQGFEGRLLKRQAGDRLLVLVNYLQQGVSVALENYQVERVVQ